jgi:hypothetical protein
MDEERDVEQTSEDEEVQAHHRRGALEEPEVRARQEDEDDEVEAHRMFDSPEEPGKRF